MKFIRIDDHHYQIAHKTPLRSLQRKQAINRIGSNQFKKRPKITIGGLCGATLALTILSLAAGHYMTLGIASGYSFSKQWAKETFIVVATAPTRLVTPKPLHGTMFVQTAFADEPKPIRKFSDDRTQKVYDFLSTKDSPLADYASLIIAEADKNDISWTLIAAISGKESSFGKVIKSDSHNAWGIMAWDLKGKRFIRSFASWEESIKFESKLLADNYRENMNRGIQEKYCPSFECSSSWVDHVTQFQEEINK